MIRFFTTLFLLTCCLNIQAQVFLDVDVHQADSIIKANEGNPIFTLLDVRTQGEYDRDHLANAYTRDFYADDYREQLEALSKDRIYLIYCQSGGRSGQTFSLMRELGFMEVYNMLGGISSWKSAGYPVTTEIPEELDLTTSTNDINIQPLLLSPNPVADNLVLNNISGTGTIKIFTALGQLVSSNRIDGSIIPIHQFQKGAYVLQFIPDDESGIFVGRFLKL